MLGIWSYIYDDLYVAGLTSFVCFAFCFVLMLIHMFACERGLTVDLLNKLFHDPVANHWRFFSNLEGKKKYGQTSARVRGRSRLGWIKTVHKFDRHSLIRSKTHVAIKREEQLPPLLPCQPSSAVLNWPSFSQTGLSKCMQCTAAALERKRSNDYYFVLIFRILRPTFQCSFLCRIRLPIGFILLNMVTKY